jgi:hypothetical protein
MIYDAVRVQVGSQDFTQVKNLHWVFHWTYLSKFSLLLQVQAQGPLVTAVATFEKSFEFAL